MWWDYELFKHLPWLTFLIFLHCPGICWWKKRERREKRVEAQRGRKENKELTPIKFPAKAPRDAKAQLCLVSGLGDKALTLSWPEMAQYNQRGGFVEVRWTLHCPKPG